jgi:hypothetical protein
VLINVNSLPYSTLEKVRVQRALFAELEGGARRTSGRFYLN